MMSDEPPDKPDRGDIAQALAKALLNTVPIVGGSAAELLDLVRLPVMKRQHAWLADLAERLRALEAEGRLRVEDLPNNEAFVDAIVRALDSVRRTREQDKREALRNAVLNVALATTPEETLREMFLGFVEQFNAWHLRLLKAMDNPEAWAQVNRVRYEPALSSSLSAFIEAAFPELGGRGDFYALLWSDLRRAGLTNTDTTGLNVMMTESGWHPSRTSDLGKQFLRFIAEP
jgi:hypothetical protein